MQQSGWREPSTGIPLRYGRYRSRYPGAVLLLFAGGIALQFTSVYTLGIGLAGLIATIAGWILIPAPGWRRALVTGPALLGVASLLAGAQSAVLVTLTLAAWLFVRMRPLRSFVVVVLPALASFWLGQFYPQYGSGVIIATVMGVSVAASAWLGREIQRRMFAQRRIDISENRVNAP